MAVTILLGALALILVGGVLVSKIKVLWLVRVGKGIAAAAVPFQRINPAASFRILVVGDSTAVGTGASDPKGSVAGRLGQDFPEAHIENRGVNGALTEEIDHQFHEGERFDLVVVHAGGNDILRWTRLEKLGADLDRLLDRAKGAAKHVVLLTAGNVGLAPFFPRPIGWRYTARTRQVREMFMGVAKGRGVHYIDLFTERDEDVFLTDPPRFYAADLLHPSGEGYRVWYESIRRKLQEIGLL